MLILFWVYRSRINKRGQAPIMMRITSNGKKITFSTNLFIALKSWDQDKQRVKGSSTLAHEINKVILNLTTSAWNAYNECIKRKLPIEPDIIRNIITSKNFYSTTITGAFTYQIDNLKARIGHDVAIYTVKKYQTTERKIKSFLTTQLSRNDMYLHELNHKFIIEFDLFMRTHEKLKHNAVMKNMQQLKRVIKICLNNGWIEKDPFVNYSCKMNETERGYLTAQELDVIEKLSLPSKRLDQVRDVFIFCCYSGLSYSNVSKLSSSHLEKEVSSMGWIRINRTKTKSKSVIPVLPSAQTNYFLMSFDEISTVVTSPFVPLYSKALSPIR